MKGSATIIGLLTLVLVVLIGVHWLVLPDPSQRNWEFFPDMVESVALDAQSPTTVLDDGTIVDLRPAPGSVARGFLPLEYPATPEGALLAGRELQSPFGPEDIDAASRGAIVYSNFCAVCHGAAGHGDGTVTRRGVPPPPNLQLEHAVQMTDGQMYHVISTGQGNMMSYASQLEREDRWRVILHVRALQAAPPATEVPDVAEIADVTGTNHPAGAADITEPTEAHDE